MKLFAAIAVLIVCVVALVRTETIRSKRQFGLYNPYGFGGGMYGPRPFGGGPYGPYGGGGYGFRRGPPTVVERTVIYRG
ncbi:hypothetical protein Q1695_001693 [Nippostrongylus brasiliensis]|nr:hypothetical protein Q1695_001693 [Nippostrongylus brasiliensis]